MNQYWVEILESAMMGAMLLLAVLGFGLATVMPSMDRWSKHFFMQFFAIDVLMVCTLFVYPFSYGDPTMTSLLMAADFLGSVLPTTLMAMLTVYLLHCCGESWRNSALFKAVFAQWVVFFFLPGAGWFSDAFYYYSADNMLHLGPWYPLLIIPVVVILALNLAGVLRRRSKLPAKRFRAFLIFLIPLTVAMVIHLFAPNFAIVYGGITISALAMYIIVVTEQVEQYVSLQQETARQRAKIAVLQMRPHFIHNTMTSIYYLCDQDPKAAQQVTMDFNTYLRKNLAAIAKDETIPFSEELEHARAYLAVEQAQFANKLVVDYDVSYTQFHVPPLTLQPLAENAVKHAMGPNTIPLRVTIRTRAVGSVSEVVVEDNGPGFDFSIADDPTTTLANIRQRLEMMCGGMLEFESRRGGGTIARVTIPHN